MSTSNFAPAFQGRVTVHSGRRPRARHFAGHLVVFLSIVSSHSAPLRLEAADQPPVAAGVPSNTQDLAAKRAELSLQITKLASAAETAPPTNSASPAVENHVEEELDLLRTLDLLYLQHQAMLEQRLEVDRQRRASDEELKALRTFGPPEAKPYSFLLLDDTRDQLAAEESRHTSLNADLADAQQQLEAAHEQFDEAEQRRRLAQEAAEDGDDDSTQASRAQELRLAELESAIGLETVTLRRLEIEVKNVRVELCELRQTLLTEKSALLARDARFTERDLKARLADLTRYGQQLKRQLKDAETHLRELDDRQLRSETELTQRSAERSVVLAARGAFQTARRLVHEQITLINQRLRELDQFRHYWEGRYEVATTPVDKDDLQEWHDSLTSFLERVQQSERALAQRIDEIRVDQATLVGRSRDGTPRDAELAPWLDLEAEHLAQLASLCENSLLRLKAAERSADRFLRELEERVEPDRRSDMLEKLRETATAFWNYELAAVDDRSITVGKVATALAYLLIGLLVARLLSRLLGGRILIRCGLNEGAAHAIQSIAFYALCVLFALLAFELVNLPFAAFTFLGGAAAIGIGFGSQNILNNFISGLILLAEQPIRVGDQVEIDGVQGTVEHIGARSTRVRTIANHEILFPNSKLLENKVTNLTLSDDLMQTAIGIQFASSLDIESAKQLLLDTARSHPKVLTTPGPVVLLKEFSPAGLAFELHFWLNLRSGMERRLVESEVRERISAAFRGTPISAAPLPSPPRAADKPLPPAATIPLRPPLRDAA